MRDGAAHVASLLSLLTQPTPTAGAPRPRSEVLLERAAPHLDALADAVKAPVATWGLTHLMTDRMARIAPKPVWVAIALGYLSALLSAVTVDPASATLMMMSV